MAFDLVRGLFRGVRPTSAVRAIALSLIAPLFLAAVFSINSSHGAVEEVRPIILLELKGAIGVASELYLSEGIEEARSKGASLLVIKLDTPGGLVSSTRMIIQQILASDVPIVVYVSPSGGHAASAGTYIVYAAHIAAMAPGTNIGAATPIQLGGIPGLPGTPDPKPEDRNRPETPSETSQSTADLKSINDAVAFLRSLAQLRGRNAEWAEKAVRSAATLTAEDALKENVVDFVARDVNELLTMVEGRTVPLEAGTTVIEVKGQPVVSLAPSWRAQVLNVIADPNVAFILLLIGVYGIVFEFYTPGFIGPGVIGAVSLILGLAALSVLPVQYAALILVLVGIAFMIAEASTPGIGIVGAGGLIAFIAGALFLFDPAEADIDVRIALPLIVSAAIMTAAILMGIAGFALKARKRAVVSGAEAMIGSTGQVLSWKDGSGTIRVHGEIWSARSQEAVGPSEMVRVVAMQGLTLDVTPAEPRRHP